jgi:hypothetical protein
MVNDDAVASYITNLKPRQVPYVPHPAVLTFLATTGTPRSFAAVGVAELVKLAPGAANTDMEIHVRGALPRALRSGENVTVSISRYDEARGYQIKTLPLRALGAESESYATAPGGLLVHGRQTYTTHHGPYELNFFERIPFDEVQRTVGRCTHAVVAVGPQVNVSPRFVWYHEVAHGRLATFHGDGVTMKTYRNLSVNKQTVRMVFDFERLTGYALFGTCEEVSPDAHPDAWKETCAGFASLGFGKPSRMFRHVCERVEPIAVRAAAKA